MAVRGVSAGMAADTEVRGGYQLEGYYDTELEENVADQRLDLGASWGRFSAGVVFLSHAPSNPQLLDPNAYGPQTSGIRKRWVTAVHGPVEARLGDSYATFGSGIVLRIIEDQSVDFDNGIDGGQVKVAWRRFSLEGISGANSYGETRTLAKGLSARAEIGRGWQAGASGAVIDSVSDETSRPGRDQIGGLQVAGPLPGGASLTAEYAARRHDPERPGRRPAADGHAIYAALSGGRGPLTLLVEGKDILRFDHAYAIPPTCVPQHSTALLNRGSHAANIRLDDERGVQSEAILSLGPSLILTGNYSASEARHAPLPAWEAFGQLEAEWLTAHWILRAAETEERIVEGDHRSFLNRITYGGDWMRPMGEWSIEFGMETQEVLKQNIARRTYEAPRDYRDSIASLTIGMAPRHVWSATAEWTTDGESPDDFWLWMEWGVRLGVLGQLNFAGGSLRGGQVCSGGVCKVVAPFEGGRIELLANF